MSAVDPLSSLQNLSSALSGLVAGVAPSVVTVRSHRARSSGFVWKPGVIATAEEALADEGDIEVMFPGGEAMPARLLGRDPTTDVALLGVERSDAPPVKLETQGVTPGALAVVVGAHEGAPAAALGVVSVAGAAWRSMRGGEIDARIELDARLRRSSEGGLALDASGRAFGMAVFGPRRRVLVIPAATIERVAARLATHGRIGRGYLGLRLQPVRLEDGGAGAMVMSVDAEGPAAAAGIRQGDVIAAWEGQPIGGIGRLLRSLGPDSVGSVVGLTLRRGGEPLEASLTIGERPEA